MGGDDEMKPIKEAHILEDACPKCRVITHYDIHLFYCGNHDLGDFSEPCDRQDWDGCPFNKQKGGEIK